MDFDTEYVWAFLESFNIQLSKTTVHSFYEALSIAI